MKTKKAMKKITHIGMAALVAMGMLGTSCNKAESPEMETPETQKENIVTLTTTVGFAADGTKALTAEGKKTFAEGETMAIYYWKNKGNDHVKAVSAPLTAGDITNGGKSATFTFTLDNPYKDMSVSYVYPAAMANADFTPNYDALYNNQDGTLATLASNFDYCTRSGAWNGDNLPSLTLENQLAILAINLKNSTDITSSITGLTLSDGTYTYNVSRSAAAGPIYVAIRPTSSATIDVTATDGTDDYVKTLSGKTYAANNGYNVTWNMTKLPKVTWNSTNVFNNSHEDDWLDKWNSDPLNYEGITISFNGSGAASGFYPHYIPDEGKAWLNCSGGKGDSFTFTAPSGKKFTKIEIINNSYITFTAYGDWTKPANTKIVWRGTPASTVTLGGSNNTFAQDLNSIVFTLKDE